MCVLRKLVVPGLLSNKLQKIVLTDFVAFVVQKMLQ